MAFGHTVHAASPLQAARLEIGWKQTQTIYALRQAAEREGVSIAAVRSLKTMLSKWENGHSRPDAVSQRLLCRVYGRTASELGFMSQSLATQALSRVAPGVGPEMVGYFDSVFTEHLRADNLMGPHHLVEVVRAQAALLERVLPSARGDVRGDLLTLAFKYSEFAGWLYQDACEPEKAMQYTDRAMEYALEIGAFQETPYVLMRKADIAADLNQPDRAIGLTDAALRDRSRVPSRIRALALRVRGRAFAQLGNTGECSRALEAAHDAVAMLDDDPGDIAAYCSPSYIGMEAANCWTTLGRYDAAVTTYERSLERWPSGLRRDQGLCLARLTVAHAGREDIERASATGIKAVEVVRSATSGRALSELQRARVRLAPWRRRTEVSELSDRIRDLIQPAA